MSVLGLQLWFDYLSARHAELSITMTKKGKGIIAMVNDEAYINVFIFEF